jgi:hypothetical protein
MSARFRFVVQADQVESNCHFGDSFKVVAVASAVTCLILQLSRIIHDSGRLQRVIFRVLPEVSFESTVRRQHPFQ